MYRQRLLSLIFLAFVVTTALVSKLLHRVPDTKLSVFVPEKIGPLSNDRSASSGTIRLVPESGPLSNASGATSPESNETIPSVPGSGPHSNESDASGGTSPQSNGRSDSGGTIISVPESGKSQEESGGAPPPSLSNVTVFYNLFVSKQGQQNGTWQIVKDQLARLSASAAWLSVGRVRTVSIGAKVESGLCDKCEIVEHRDEGSELLTIEHLHNFCKTNPLATVAYMHDKGSLNSRGGLNDRLRNMHMRSIAACVSSPNNLLAEGSCDVCAARFSIVPHWHTSGNMWVARCDYVRKLIAPAEMAAAMARAYAHDQEARAVQWNVGLGRFGMEHWVMTHPSVRPCDVFPGTSFTFAYYGIPVNDNWEPNLIPAPRFPLSKFAKAADAHQCKCSWRQRSLKNRWAEWEALGYKNFCGRFDVADWAYGYFNETALGLENAPCFNP